ncbi:Glycosyltransferase involved in cell wall bisynthesis [Halomonas cupida]|uniref:Glycosyltransferase involved in cell wall bisynthesis n=1 Tax=Halomonas cupida TaxID=44933 RepID=A0A1M7LUA1_9GAMM|nr:Glycosyltransferase involved in cell wall bisynthesis [Halomonas cupida]
MAVNLADAFAAAGHESHLVSFRDVKRPLAPEHDDVQAHKLPLMKYARLTGVGYLLEMAARLFLNPFVERSLFLGSGVMGGVVFRCWLRAFERQHGKVDRIVFRGQGTFEQVWSFRDHRARYVLENIFHVEGASWRRRLFSGCLYHGRHLVAVSEGVAQSVRQALPLWRFTPCSLEVIPNPCPVDSIRSRMQERVPELPEGPYLVNVARLVPAKDHELLLRAYAMSGVEMPMVVVGEGQQRDALQRLAQELGIEERVIFTGSQQNPYPWMHHARLFVLSSRFEGMGIVLFEALACDTPVLAVDCPGGIRQILKGELESSIVAREVEALAEGIRLAVEGPKPRIREEWLDDFLPRRVAGAFLAS